MIKSQSQKQEVGGRSLIIDTGKFAGQAHGAVTVRYGDTVVLATTCTRSEPREGIDFLPLTVDYEERLYAAGKIPGGFIRREGRPSQEATLAARLTDRPLRRTLRAAARQLGRADPRTACRCAGQARAAGRRTVRTRRLVQALRGA